MKAGIGKSVTLGLTIATALAVSSISAAQVVQNPLGVPRAPGCDPGYSWNKSGNRYQCMTPPPSCQYGFSSGPVWSGTSWTYACNAPPPPPPVSPPGDPDANCIAAAPLYSYTVTKGPVAVYAAGGNSCLGLECRVFQGKGPRVVVTECGDTSATYTLYCYVNADRSVNRVTGLVQPENITCGGGGG
jgi:hypothetical protein